MKAFLILAMAAISLDIDFLMTAAYVSLRGGQRGHGWLLRCQTSIGGP